MDRVDDRQNGRFINDAGCDVTQGLAAGNRAFGVYWKHRLFSRLHHDQADKEIHIHLMKVKLSVRIEQDDKSLNPGESRHQRTIQKSSAAGSSDEPPDEGNHI